MYVKPEVTKYSGKELIDLMGPVETAYCDIPEALPNCGRLEMSIPLCMDDPEVLRIAYNESDYTQGVPSSGFSIEDGVLIVDHPDYCLTQQPGTIEVEFSFERDEGRESCVSCTQEITFPPRNP